GVWLDADQLAGLDQRGDDRPVFGAAIRAGEECVLSVQSHRPDRALDDIAVDLDAPVVEEETEAGPARESVADGFGELGFLADQGELLAQPWLERFYQRARALLPDGSTLIGATTTDLALDAVQAGDTR